jgi:hypothetical protein
MSPLKIALGFLPWIAFSMIATRAGAGAVGMAALVALTVAAVLTARSLARHESVKLLEGTALATFAVMGGWALIDPASDGFLAFYGRGLATLVLVAAILVTLPFRPFTEQYARESVPQKFWDSPHFHAANRKISAAWAGVTAAMGIGHLVAGALAANASEHVGYLTFSPVELSLNWILPGVLILAAVRYTQHVARAAHAAASTSVPVTR